MTRFDPVYNPTADDTNRLDVHEDPPGLWSRVAVIGMWQDSKITRKRWPLASVVGPLRTKSGVDLLVRNLLANPQVRVVVIDGPTGGVVGEDTKEALFSLFCGESHRTLLGDDIGHPEAAELVHEVTLLDVKEGWRPRGEPNDLRFFCAGEARKYVEIEEKDRSSPAIRILAPSPKASSSAPHGDPGERVAGDTLAEVWPLVLQTAMRFGREVPTQYGTTKEFLNLVSVIRDPLASLAGFGDGGEVVIGENGLGQGVHPILGLTYATVETYTHDQLIGSVVPEGQSYGYGSRMHGVGGWRIQEDLLRILNNSTHDGGEIESQGISAAVRDFTEGNSDQLEAIKKLLTDKPDTRAAYLTPWRSDEDSGKESGRPCLVGVMFRVTPEKCDDDLSNRKTYAVQPMMTQSWNGHKPQSMHVVANTRLHMTVTFRSHDLHGAYPLNLAGCCLWLVEWARDLGMAVGTLTCHSHSAHVYDRDWAKAEAVVEASPKPALRWDQRSVWRVEKVEGPKPASGPWSCEEIEEAEDNGLQCCGEPATCVDDDRHYFCDEHKTFESKPLPRQPILRAVALAADGQGSVINSTKPIAVLEAESPSALRLAITRSGLVTETGAAMWLGAEIERVWGAK